MTQSQDSNRLTLCISTFTVACVTIMVLGKLGAYLLSGSTTVLSSLLDSITDLGLSVMTLLAVKFAQKPPDSEHREGHGKIEGVAALLQAAFIAGAGALLILESVNRLLEPEPLQNQGIALYMQLGATVLSAILVAVQRWGMRHHNSLALEADHRHYSTDIFINLAGAGVLFFDRVGEAPFWLDPVCAMLIAGLMGVIAFRIAHRSLDMLLDRELPQDMRDAIDAVIKAQADVHGYHDLRTRMAGQRPAISFDLSVNADLSLRDAHAIARRVELALLDRFPTASILIHVDPDDDPHDTRHSEQA
jgi:ferrous-iron efflux pump FieF